MKLNKDAIKNVINYISEKQTFDFEDGCMSEIELTTIVNDLSNGNEDQMQEIACALYRCIQEHLIDSDYPSIIWGKAVVYDITFRGFTWLENN